MTADEKTQLALDTLHSLTYEPRTAAQCSTTNPGPMPIEQMMYLERHARMMERESVETKSNRDNR